MASNILGSLLLLIKTKGDVSGLNKTDKAIKKTTKSLQKMSKSTGIFSGLSNKLFRGFNLSNMWGGAMNYLQFEKDLGAIHSRFYALEQDHKKASEEFDYIRNLASETAMDIKKTADSYSIFYASTRRTLGKEGARGVFEDWTRVSRVLHLSEHQFERVTYALREMASKGAIYSQDLRMQIGTHVPNAMGLAQKAAEQMGFTGVDWFDKLQKAAKGNTKITTEFVRLFSKEARKAYGGEQAFKEAMKQPDALAQTIANKAFEIKYNFSKAGGGYMIVKILEGVRDTIAKIPFDRITNVLGSIAKGIGNIFSKLPIIIELLKNILIAIAIIQMHKWFSKASSIFMTTFKGFKGNVSAIYKIMYSINRVLSYISKFLLGSGLYMSLSKIPVLGQVATLGIVIGSIYTLLRRYLMRKEFKQVYGDRNAKIGNTGFTLGQAYDIAKNFSSKGIKSQSELEKQLLLNNARELIGTVYINDKSQIVMNVKNLEAPLEDISDVIGSKINEVRSNQRKIALNMFNKPISTKEEKEYLKSIYRGR